MHQKQAFGWNYASRWASYFVYLLLFLSTLFSFPPHSLFLFHYLVCIYQHENPCVPKNRKEKKKPKTKMDIEKREGERAMDIEDIFRRKQKGRGNMTLSL